MTLEDGAVTTLNMYTSWDSGEDSLAPQEGVGHRCQDLPLPSCPGELTSVIPQVAPHMVAKAESCTPPPPVDSLSGHQQAPPSGS